jgi:DNA invertase Pin-like site-specific DNA recombinase
MERAQLQQLLRDAAGKKFDVVLVDDLSRLSRYVDDLPTMLDTDLPKARAILMRVLRPFTLTPDGDSYRISGALNLSAVVGPGVSEISSSGGVI